jgi:hypothetical protein
MTAYIKEENWSLNLLTTTILMQRLENITCQRFQQNPLNLFKKLQYLSAVLLKIQVPWDVNAV